MSEFGTGLRAHLGHPLEGEPAVAPPLEHAVDELARVGQRRTGG